MTTQAPNRHATARGFAIYDEFLDDHGCVVRVQKSSAATASLVWIFCANRDDPEKDCSPHLDVAGARRLRDALNTFIRENK